MPHSRWGWDLERRRDLSGDLSPGPARQGWRVRSWKEAGLVLFACPQVYVGQCRFGLAAGIT